MTNFEVTYLTIMKLSNNTYPIYCENGLIYSKSDNHLMTASELIEILMELY